MASMLESLLILVQLLFNAKLYANVHDTAMYSSLSTAGHELSMHSVCLICRSVVNLCTSGTCGESYI